MLYPAPEQELLFQTHLSRELKAKLHHLVSGQSINAMHLFPEFRLSAKNGFGGRFIHKHGKKKIELHLESVIKT